MERCGLLRQPGIHAVLRLLARIAPCDPFGENRSAAAAIHEDYRDWRAIQGVQLAGTATRLHGAEREAALACYREKFAFLNNPVAELVPVLEALGKAACYRLTPSELHFIDNATGFGKRIEVFHFNK